MTETLTSYTQTTVDRNALVLAALFLTVAIASVLLVPAFQADTGDAGDGGGAERVLEDESAATQGAAGVGWVVAEVALAVILIALIFVWRRLPDWLQKALSDDLEYAAFMFLGALAYLNGGSETFWAVAAAVIIFNTTTSIMHRFDVFWVLNNVIAIIIAIAIAAVGGVVLGPVIIAVGLVGLAVYDHWFANKESWMFTLAGSMVNLKLPVIILFPSSWRVDWDTLASDVAGEKEDEGDSGVGGLAIGTADVMLPAMFAASVAAATDGVGFVVWGVLAGIAMAAFRLRWEMLHRGSGAGLPAIAAGTLGGYGMAFLFVWAVALV